VICLGAVATKKRSTTAQGKKPSTRSTKSPARKRTAKAAEPLVVDEPLPELPVESALVAPIVTMVPEPSFAARIAPPPPPRPRPEQRRGIFFDVENTSRAQDIEYVLRHLMIDRVGIDTDFTAVGNWRVIGHETARLLAENGAHLVHSAPSVGVRDWSDLRIAVAAGVWLAGTRPGDMIDVVSDDQAFDAVGDVASSLGVQYRRLSYRSLRGQLGEEVRHVAADGEARGGRNRGRGGRGRRSSGGRRYEQAPRHPAPMPHRQPPPRPAVAAVVEDDANAHTAPHDELIDVVRDLMHTAPGGVTLDQLANALRERGFRRTSGSPRLITRLKRIKQLDVNRNGLIRLVDAEVEATPHHRHAPAPVEDADDGFSIDPEEAGEGEDEQAVAADAGEGPSDTEPSSAEGGQRRRRRRRGGRRRRGRRGGGNGANGNGAEGGEVLAAAPAGPSSEY
jgi:hypothetical protein